MQDTQLLSGASCGAHGDRLPDNQHVKTGPWTSKLAGCIHHVSMSLGYKIVCEYIVVEKLFTAIQNIQAPLRQMTRNGCIQILSRQFSPTRPLQHATNSSMACQVTAVVEAICICFKLDAA
jgi:hypothetical protein